MTWFSERSLAPGRHCDMESDNCSVRMIAGYCTHATRFANCRHYIERIESPDRIAAGCMARWQAYWGDGRLGTPGHSRNSRCHSIYSCFHNQESATINSFRGSAAKPTSSLNGTLCVSHFRAQHPQCCPSFVGVVMPQLCRAMAQMTAIWRTRRTKRGLIQRKLGEIWMTILHLHMESLAGATE